MGIWVRNQLKNQLHLITDFRIIDIGKYLYRICGISNCGLEYTLGDYEDIERVLEVLNSIQDFIQCDGEMNNCKLKVFEMPEI